MFAFLEFTIIMIYVKFFLAYIFLDSKPGIKTAKTENLHKKTTGKFMILFLSMESLETFNMEKYMAE